MMAPALAAPSRGYHKPRPATRDYTTATEDPTPAQIPTISAGAHYKQSTHPYPYLHGATMSTTNASAQATAPEPAPETTLAVSSRGYHKPRPATRDYTTATEDPTPTQIPTISAGAHYKQSTRPYPYFHATTLPTTNVSKPAPAS